MLLETIYQCDLCGKRIRMSYDNKPTRMVTTYYDPCASTNSYSTHSLDLCEECASKVRKTQNELKEKKQ